MLQSLVHYSLHFLAPAALAYGLFRSRWRWAYLVMLLSMLFDLDHLMATPIFDPSRCSIGYHPLHTAWAALGSLALLLVPRWWVRALAVGWLFHLLTDLIDCWWMFSYCPGCCDPQYFPFPCP